MALLCRSNPPPPQPLLCRHSASFALCDQAAPAKKALRNVQACEAESLDVAADLREHREALVSTQEDLAEGWEQYERTRELYKRVKRGQAINTALIIGCSLLMALTIALIHWYHEYWE